VARIRSIKPEILTDEKSAGLSDTEWRLFVSCIVMADDYGNFRASPAFIHSQVFWACSTSREDSRKALETLAIVSIVQLYDDSGQQYGHICGWSKHQRVDHPGKPLCPREPSRESREASRESREKPPQPFVLPSWRDSRETLVPDRDKDKERDKEKEGRGAPGPFGKFRPRTTHDLELCMRIAVQKAQPQIGHWIPGRFSTSDANKLLSDLGDIEAALPEVEKKIQLFAVDPGMAPWTIARFVDQFNVIGQPRQPSQTGKPIRMQARY
jgi:hypothetical protein